MKKYLDFKLIKIIAIFYGVIVSVSFFKIAYFLVKSENFNSESHNWFETIFDYAILDWIIIIPYMIIIAIVTKIMFEKQVKSKYIILFHLFISLFIGWLILFSQGTFLYLIGRINLNTFYDYISYNTVIQYLDTTFLIYLVITAIIYIYYYIQKIKDVESQKALLVSQLSNVKMKALKAQLQPHFLFNTLNSISALIESNSKQAQNSLADLSDLLREIINLKEDSFITIEQELSLLKKYFDIILIRFSDHLTIKTKIESNVKKCIVPSMILQPLVEYSIKQGFSFNYTDLDLELNIHKEQKKLFIYIIHNGNPMNNHLQNFHKKGTVLNNTLERLKTLYQKNYEFYIDNKKDCNGVKMVIVIPFEISKNITNKFNYTEIV